MGLENKAQWFASMTIFAKKKICELLREPFFRLTRIKVDKKSKIAAILNDCWDDYSKDLFPKDRRMAIIREKNVQSKSSENIHFLINEIVSRLAQNGAYLEVGTFQGGSLLSAALFNPKTRCIGIDNFSEYNEDGCNEKILKENLGRFKQPKNIELFKGDYQEQIRLLFSKELSLKINVYFYDGNHSFENQLQGLKIMLPLLSEKCVILVDDINWVQVEQANREFLKQNPKFKSVFKIKTRSHSEQWWNGFEVITRGI